MATAERNDKYEDTGMLIRNYFSIDGSSVDEIYNDTVNESQDILA